MSARLRLLGIVLLALGGAALIPSGAAADPGPARLGIQLQEMTPALRAWFQAPQTAGVLVARVEPDSPAQEAGVQVGDVIVEAGGEALETPRDLVWQALRAPEGEPLKLVVLRKGQNPEDLVVAAFNLTPVPRSRFRIGLPIGGYWQEILNTDAEIYGGSGMGNYGGREADAKPWHGRPCSLEVVMPPLAAVFFKPGKPDENS